MFFFELYKIGNVNDKIWMELIDVQLSSIMTLICTKLTNDNMDACIKRIAQCIYADLTKDHDKCGTILHQSYTVLSSLIVENSHY